MRRFWSLDELARRRDLMLVALLAALALDGILAAALAVKAIQRRPVLVLPADREVMPGEVTDAAARAFARLYVVTFDTFTPSTLPASTEWLKSRIAPRTWSRAAEALDRRVAVAREGRMSSIAVPLEEGRVERHERFVAVTVRARRAIYIADQLSREAEVVYRVEIEAAPPTPANPSGLVVISQNVEEPKEPNDETPR